MQIEHMTVLASGAAILAAVISGIAADTWGFAVFLSIVTFVWFKGIAVALGLLPEFASGYALSSLWFASLAGNLVGAAASESWGISYDVARRASARLVQWSERNLRWVIP